MANCVCFRVGELVKGCTVIGLLWNMSHCLRYQRYVRLFMEKKERPNRPPSQPKGVWKHNKREKTYKPDYSKQPYVLCIILTIYIYIYMYYSISTYSVRSPQTHTYIYIVNFKIDRNHPTSHPIFWPGGGQPSLQSMRPESCHLVGQLGWGGQGHGQITLGTGQKLSWTPRVVIHWHNSSLIMI